ncbi:hypothetical protein G6F57_021651 [Rhizopus arrhizus]|nr:hypothetical protein G6F57_021651 [Rhizopus arrhizus]
MGGERHVGAPQQAYRLIGSANRHGNPHQFTAGDIAVDQAGRNEPDCFILQRELKIQRDRQAADHCRAFGHAECGQDAIRRLADECARRRQKEVIGSKRARCDGAPEDGMSRADDDRERLAKEVLEAHSRHG